jgi:hypothetical protein
MIDFPPFKHTKADQTSRVLADSSLTYATPQTDWTRNSFLILFLNIIRTQLRGKMQLNGMLVNYCTLVQRNQE